MKLLAFLYVLTCTIAAALAAAVLDTGKDISSSAIHSSVSLQPSLTGVSSPDALETLLGNAGTNGVATDCHGSSMCKGCQKLTAIQDYTNKGLYGGRLGWTYTNGEKIACAPDCPLTGGLCLFAEDMPPGHVVSAATIKDLLQKMIDAGCHKCGKTEIEGGGWLKADYVQHTCKTETVLGGMCNWEARD